MTADAGSEEAPSLAAIEAAIDSTFADNALIRLPFAQAAWTLLSVIEDHHFKITTFSPLEDRLAAIYVDGLMNSLTHPMRVLLRVSTKGRLDFERRVVDQHYQLAQDWLHSAKSYSSFCAMFPLYHAKRINLRVEGQRIIPSCRSDEDYSYEVYNRFMAKRDPELEKEIDPGQLSVLLRAAMKVRPDGFSLHFTRRLIESLHLTFGDRLGKRHTLPKGWIFESFSLKAFREVVICLQLLAHAWFLARQLAAARGAMGLAFASSVWTPNKAHLVETLSRFCSVEKKVVADVLRYITFGEMGIRHPDVAVQPLVDLSNGQYAIAPFLLMHTNIERNLCVLLNQIPSERKIYSRLVAQKEEQMRAGAMSSLREKNLDLRYGPLDDTDIDLAIIDRTNKVCLCVELKWFIEPAEVREIFERSQEIAKGVAQAKTIAEAFSHSAPRLMKLLEIDDSYDFLAAVASVNSIGSHEVQDAKVPVIKLWHLMAEIMRSERLSGVVQWLRDRAYLPQSNRYKVVDVEIQIGNWRSTWYGIQYSNSGKQFGAV